MATEFVLRIRADGSAEVVNQMARVESSVTRVKQAGQGGADGLRGLRGEASGLTDSLGGATAAAGGLSSSLARLATGAAGGLALAALARQTVEIGRAMLETQVSTQKLQATLSYVAGGATGAGVELEYLRSVSNRLGVEFQSSATAYARFAAATKENGISAQNTKELFEGVAKASSQFGLSAEETSGALLALSQMASKGTISAEELRGQLGERLPGAFSLAAKAMGVTEAALGKMMEKGEVAASDFLPRFARQLNETFSQPVNNVVSEINRLSSAFDLFKQSLFEGSAGGLFASLTASLNESAAAMRALGKDAGVTHRLLVAVGGALAGAAGVQRFDVAGRQKTIMENELPALKREIAALEEKRAASVFNRLNLLDAGKLNELQARAKALKSELLDLASAQGKLSGFKDPDIAGQYRAQQAKSQERLKGYLDDTSNETKTVKIAAAIEDENKKFRAATLGLDKASQEYVSALEAHQRRLAEINARGAGGGGGGRGLGLDAQRYRRLQELSRQLDDELRQIEMQKRKQQAQDVATAVMERTVGNLQDTYRRQIAIYDEREMTAPQRSLAEALRKVEEAADSARESLAAKAATLHDDDVSALEAYRQAMISVNTEEQRQIALIREYEEEQERLNGLWETGATRALRKYLDSGKSVAEQTEEAFTRAFGNMEDALIAFLQTGKGSFREFAQALIADLARIELRALMASQLASSGSIGGLIGSLASQVFSLGSGIAGNLAATLNGYQTMNHALTNSLHFDAKGSAYGPSGPIQEFARGGIVSKPVLFRYARGGSFGLGVMGEAGDEAVMPLARDMLGRDAHGRLGLRRGAIGGGMQLTVNVSGANGDLGQVRHSAAHGAREALALLFKAQRYG